jgi:hypothetical protein
MSVISVISENLKTQRNKFKCEMEMVNLANVEPWDRNIFNASKQNTAEWRQKGAPNNLA